MKNQFEILNTPIRIGNMVLKNRIAFPPMNTNYANEFGSPTEQMIEYYAKRARGGAALVAIEAVSVDAESKNHGGQPLLCDESLVPVWSKLTDRVARYGAKTTIEITHYGSEGNFGDKVSSSDVTGKGVFPVRPLNISEIRDIEDKYAKAAKLAKNSGFDAVTFHGCHGSLINQFLSPLYNKRTDVYGGSLENRLRFILQIIEKTRKNVGNNFPIIVRIPCDEFLKDGLKIDDTIKIAVALDKAGVDALDISGGNPKSYVFSISPNNFPGKSGLMMLSAKKIKASVNVPVIAAGSRIRDPYTAEKFLQDECADMISFGRSFIADPNFGLKSLYGDQADIRPCLSCQNCFKSLSSGSFLTCAVNAETGREAEFKDIEKSHTSKNILVVGGGAAGMEAARVAGLRGHRVKLIEKSDKLGGTLYAASIPHNKEKISELIKWYEKQLKDLNVEVLLNSSYSPSMITEGRIDVLLLAIGSSVIRRIPGSENRNVLSAVDALTNPNKVGQRVVIIGGGATGCETAEYFGAKYEINMKYVNDLNGEFVCEKTKLPNVTNKVVTIIEMLDEIGVDIENRSRALMKFTLEENEVKILTNTRVENIYDDIVSVLNLKTGRKSEINADTVILAGGLSPNSIDIDCPDNVDIYNLGDCDKPSNMVRAIYQAYYVAANI